MERWQTEPPPTHTSWGHTFTNNILLRELLARAILSSTDHVRVQCSFASQAGFPEAALTSLLIGEELLPELRAKPSVYRVRQLMCLRRVAFNHLFEKTVEGHCLRDEEWLSVTITLNQSDPVNHWLVLSLRVPLFGKCVTIFRVYKGKALLRAVAPSEGSC